MRVGSAPSRRKTWIRWPPTSSTSPRSLHAVTRGVSAIPAPFLLLLPLLALLVRVGNRQRSGVEEAGVGVGLVSDDQEPGAAGVAAVLDRQGLVWLEAACEGSRPGRDRNGERVV